MKLSRQDAKKWELFVTNWHPARVNQWAGRHWSAKHRLRTSDYEILRWDSNSEEVPLAQGKRRVSLEIVLGPRQRAGDPDAYWKLLLDNLKHLGLIRDDSREWLELGTVTFRRGPQRATAITLEDVGPT